MTRPLAIGLVALLSAGPASAYTHFPPPTLAQLCVMSNNVRVLTVDQADRERGVIAFTITDKMRGNDPWGVAKHRTRPDDPGAKAILGWAEKGKVAVMFTSEQPSHQYPNGSGYVFHDGGCFSVDYSVRSGHWTVLRQEPGMSACYSGTVEQLRGLTKDLLAGKKVDVPTKEPAVKEDRGKRAKEVDDLLKNR
jgi:hypothetical protein